MAKLVKYYVDNANQILGVEPHSTISEEIEVYCEDYDDAVEIAMDCLAEHLAETYSSSEYEIEVDENITIFKDGKAIEQYYNFEEVEREDQNDEN